MKKQLFMGLMLTFFVASPAALIAQTVYFNSGNAELDATSKQTLNELWTKYKTTTDKQIYLAGYSDTLGNEELNFALTQERLDNVKSYLSALGYSNTFFEDNYGESKTKSSQATVKERKQSRKIELQIIGEENLRCAEELDYTSLFEPATTSKNIDITREDTIIGKDGTVVAFQANSFVDKFGNPVTEPVSIVLEEFNSLDALIKNGMTTQQENSQILQTGGTINLTASVNGEEVFLAQDKPVAIGFPSKQDDDGMELYGGKKDNTGKVIWDNSPTSIAAVLNFDLKAEPSSYYALDLEGDTIEKSIFITTRNPKGETVRAGKIWRRGQQIIYDTLAELTATTTGNNSRFIRFTNLGFINLDKSIKFDTGVNANVIAQGEGRYSIYAILIDRNGVSGGIPSGFYASNFKLSKTERVKFIAIGKGKDGCLEYAEALFDPNKKNYKLMPKPLPKPEDLNVLSMN